MIAIDGKTLRRSGSKTSKKKKQDLAGPIHVVSAFAAGQRLVLGQVKVGEKSNEIVAIPKLLKLLAIEGAVVTIDAMGCQRDISQAIIDKKADYILALKGNQGTLKLIFYTCDLPAVLKSLIFLDRRQKIRENVVPRNHKLWLT